MIDEMTEFSNFKIRSKPTALGLVAKKPDVYVSNYHTLSGVIVSRWMMGTHTLDWEVLGVCRRDKECSNQIN
jgi:hypothetical protein